MVSVPQFGFFSIVKSYSEDLRERVLSTCAEGGRSIGAVAAQFRVSVSFVHKLRRRQRTTGSIAALPLRDGPGPLLDAAARAELAACVARQPDATLDELHCPLAAAGARRDAIQICGRNQRQPDPHAPLRPGHRGPAG